MTNEGMASREMPKYQCHKKVWALKIKEIEDISNRNQQVGEVSGLMPGEAGRIWKITPDEDGYAPFTVDENYISKHKPTEGGYYVVYDDGYKSFSPADAFEGGYTLIQK